MDLATAYCAGRAELAQILLDQCKHPDALEAVQRTLWSPAYCQQNGQPNYFFSPPKNSYRQQVVGFERAPLAVERLENQYLRLQVSSNWYLNLKAFKNSQDYFSQLSKKLKKRLRWLRNVYEKQDFKLVPIKTRDGLEAFLQIFAQQRPHSPWTSQLKAALFETYQTLEQAHKNHSYLLVDSQDQPVAGALGYHTDTAFNLHMLAYAPGQYDSYSPGLYITYKLIDNMINEAKFSAFIFGPGEYEYKKRFLGTAFPIYRYEQLTWKNVWGILKLYNRYRKELKNA